MPDVLRVARPWLTFAGFVLIVAVLYWAQAFIVPVALAMLFAFMLSPLVAALQRRLGRVLAVLLVVISTFSLIGLAGWILTQQVSSLAQDLPHYRSNIRAKIRDIQASSHGGSVDALQKTVEDIRAEIQHDPIGSAPAEPVVVQPEPTTTLLSFPTALGPLLEWLATAGLVVVLVIFMLLERQDLRNRVIQLFGHGRLAVTTRAFDEAQRRVSRYLLVQSLLNLSFGAGLAVALFLIGVPYPLLWASLAAALRFIPYVGPLIGAAAPILVSLAALEGWTRPLLVAGVFVGLELFTNLVLETFFYAGAAGVSQATLLVAVSFWTWLWGPVGLFLATPLTVCLAVIGKYVPGLEFVSTLLSDQAAFEPDLSFYQRVLAGDQAEAAELLEKYTKEGGSPETVFDAILLPALNYAERDRVEGRLSQDEEMAVVASANELFAEAAGLAAVRPEETSPGPMAFRDQERIAVLGCPADGEADVLALRMLGRLLAGTPFTLEVVPEPLHSTRILELLAEGGCAVVCIADLPPSAPSRSRYLVRRLRAASPETKLLVGRWAPPALRDDGAEPLLQAGADAVATTLLETREQLAELLPGLRAAAPIAQAAAGTS